MRSPVAHSTARIIELPPLSSARNSDDSVHVPFASRAWALIEASVTCASDEKPALPSSRMFSLSVPVLPSAPCCARCRRSLPVLREWVRCRNLRDMSAGCPNLLAVKSLQLLLPPTPSFALLMDPRSQIWCGGGTQKHLPRLVSRHGTF